MSITGASARMVDSSLPGLDLLWRPDDLREVLVGLLRDRLWPGQQLCQIEPTVRRYVPGKRCLVEFALTTGASEGEVREPHRVVGKLYARHDDGAKVRDSLQELWQAGFAAGPLRAPEPLGYDSTWQLLVLSWTPGRSLREILIAEKETPAEFDTAARWLFKLHTCGATTTGRRYDFIRQLRTLRRWQREMAAIVPDLAIVFGEIVSTLRKHFTFFPTTASPVHRDFSPDHLVFDGRDVTGLDFDEYCQYDRLFDVAHFIVHLRWLGLSRFDTLDRFDAMAERFELAYRALGHDYSVSRVRLFQVVAYLKLVRIVAVVTRPLGWQRQVDVLLGEAARLL